MVDLEFGDLVTKKDLEFPIMEQNCNINVQIINRRMYSDYKDKENTRLRVKKHREQKRVKRKRNAKSNTDVTVTSSSSSSSSLDLSKDKSGQVPFHFEFHVGEFLDDILSACKKIKKLPVKQKDQFNPHMWVQVQTNNSGHPQAILESLEALIDYWPDVKNPWTYANKIMATKSGNYHEADHIEQHQEFKRAFDIDPRVKELLKPIGKT